ncbi:hypothetical protein PMI34_05081 [Pseudomonas sp. GM74]|nr:hypothetical protein PMI34_05081 [Pseudomonas sp. GM74]
MIMIPLAELDNNFPGNDLSNVTRALLLLVLPTPLLLVLYRLFAKAARKRARDSR